MIASGPAADAIFVLQGRGCGSGTDTGYSKNATVTIAAGGSTTRPTQDTLDQFFYDPAQRTPRKREAIPIEF
jgi:hypothetical protein